MTGRRNFFIKATSRFLWFFCVLFLFWSTGLFLFYLNLIQGQEKINLSEKTDSIVVLTGGKGRVSAGVNLLTQTEEGPRQLFISGVAKGVPIKELLGHLPLNQDDVTCCVALGYEAKNTRENARETASWMEQKGFGSIRLVTGHYHMPRSLLEFHHVMPQYQITPHPIVPPLFQKSDWHARIDQMYVLCLEYCKYLLALVRLQLITWFPNFGLQ